MKTLIWTVVGLVIIGGIGDYAFNHTKTAPAPIVQTQTTAPVTTATAPASAPAPVSTAPNLLGIGACDISGVTSIEEDLVSPSADPTVTLSVQGNNLMDGSTNENQYKQQICPDMTTWNEVAASGNTNGTWFTSSIMSNAEFNISQTTDLTGVTYYILQKHQILASQPGKVDIYYLKIQKNTGLVAELSDVLVPGTDLMTSQSFYQIQQANESAFSADSMPTFWSYQSANGQWTD